jgi:WD repeat-containing protein 26
MVHAAAAFEWSGKRLRNAGNSLKRVPSQTASFLSVNGGKQDEDDDVGGGAGLPFTQSPEPMSPMRHRTSDAAQSTYGPASAFGVDMKTPPTSPISDPQTEAEQAPVSNGAAPKRGRFVTAVRSVMIRQTVSRLAAFNPRPQRQGTTSSTVTAGRSETSGRRMTMDSVPALRGSRVANLMPKLRTLVATQDLAAHQGLVRHLQFSPNGKFLATSR